MQLLSVIRPGGRLVLIRKTEPIRRQLVYVTIALALVVLLLIGYLIAIRYSPGLLVFTVLVGVIFLALLARAYDLRRLTEREDSFCFDRENDSLFHNGEKVAPLTHINQIVVREIVPTQDEAERPSAYALVVELGDTRRITLAETPGMPTAGAEIEAAAKEISSYLGVGVEKASRTETEWWVDR